MKEEKFYCPNCEWEVQEGDPKCYNCDQELVWDEIKKEKKEGKKNVLVETLEEYSPAVKLVKKIKENKKEGNEDIKDTYNFYLRMASFYKGLYVFIGLIVMLVGVIISVVTELFYLMLVAFVLESIIIGFAILLEKNLKYKAYVLKNLHQINLNTKK